MAFRELSKPHGVIVFGLNGSGKTILSRELANVMNFKHMDIEDYHFHESEIPYSNPRTRNECLNLMLADIEKHGSFVVSVVNGDYLGEKIVSMCMLAIYITVPADVRNKRIKQRGYDRFGERVCEGGDMYEQELKFYHYAASRSSDPIEQWLKTLELPVIYVDGHEDYKETAVKVARLYDEILQQNINDMPR